MARALESWTHAWSWVDWSATGAWMQAWAGLAQAGAVLVVAYKGAGALRTWKLQKVAERRFDTAERIAIASYRLRQAFEDIRIMLIGANELAEARAMLLATEQADEFGQLPLRRQQRTVTAQAMLNRINRHSSEWDELLALIPVSQAFMVPEIAEKLSSIWKMRGHLIVSAGMYAEDFAYDPELLEKIRQDLYQGVAREHNEINKQLEDAFSTIERLLKPILQDAGEASTH